MLKRDSCRTSPIPRSCRIRRNSAYHQRDLTIIRCNTPQNQHSQQRRPSNFLLKSRSNSSHSNISRALHLYFRPRRTRISHPHTPRCRRQTLLPLPKHNGRRQKRKSNDCGFNRQLQFEHDIVQRRPSIRLHHPGSHPRHLHLRQLAPVSLSLDFLEQLRPQRRLKQRSFQQMQVNLGDLQEGRRSFLGDSVH